MGDTGLTEIENHSAGVDLQKERAAHKYPDLRGVRYGVQKWIWEPSLGGTHVKLILMTTSLPGGRLDIEKVIPGEYYFI